MTDLTPGSAEERANFPNREWWEVVVVHVAFLFTRRKAIQFLAFTWCAQGRQSQHLRLAAGEETGAMGSRADVDLACNLADVRRPAAIGSFLFLNDLGADRFLMNRLERFSQRTFILSLFTP